MAAQPSPVRFPVQALSRSVEVQKSRRGWSVVVEVTTAEKKGPDLKSAAGQLERDMSAILLDKKVNKITKL